MSRGRGRPSLSPTEASVPVNVKMPASLYDHAYRAAGVRLVSVPELMRRALLRDLETQNCKKTDRPSE